MHCMFCGLVDSFLNRFDTSTDLSPLTLVELAVTLLTLPIWVSLHILLQAQVLQLVD
jgi:hypothetical protein